MLTFALHMYIGEMNLYSILIGIKKFAHWLVDLGFDLIVELIHMFYRVMKYIKDLTYFIR